MKLFIQMPYPFTGAKTFCADPNFLSQPKNLTAFSASSKTFVPAQKTILLNANHLFIWQKMFVTATICRQIFGLAQKIWTSPKHFGTCQRPRHKILKCVVSCPTCPKNLEWPLTFIIQMDVNFPISFSVKTIELNLMSLNSVMRCFKGDFKNEH